jgi:nucleobase:cation symporter-1, NCS1 family
VEQRRRELNGEQRPASDSVGAIETRGIEPVPDGERHGRPFELFWVWFAGNLGILGVVYGAILVASGLNFWQSALVALVGSAGSFVLVGALSVAGKWGGAPMLTLSRAPFGTRGNLGPTLVSWINLLGWETVIVVIATYALLGIFEILGLPADDALTVIGLISILLLVILVGLLGHATLVWLQRLSTWVFGLLTLIVAIFLTVKTDWPAVLDAPAGPWVSGVLATLSIIAAGTGIGWANAGADYSRYLPRDTSGRGVVLWTVVGATIPLFFLMIVGVLVSFGTVEDLSASPNPIAAIREALPTWMAVPYLLTAIGGLLPAPILSLYSSGLNLLVLGVKMERYKTVVIDGAVVVVGAILVMLVAQDFFGPFQSFLQLLAVGLSTWSAVFLVDMLMRRGYHAPSLSETGPRSRYFYRGGCNWAALLAWGAGILIGLSLTSSPLFTGPLAVGVFAESSLGYFVGFLVAAVLYFLLARSSLAGLGTQEEAKGEVRESANA